MNLQKPERKLIQKTLHDEYFVTKVFDTIQGEGPYSGQPAIFVRLAGCNLQCPQCDTEYTERSKMSVGDIFSILEKSKLRRVDNETLVVITGGEPFRQPIWPLVDFLIHRNFHVQIETNGTLIQPGDWHMDHITIVCSPKTPKIDRKLYPVIDAYKYVVDHRYVDPYDGLPTRVLGYNVRPARPRSGVPVFISPADVYDPSENALNAKAAATICMDFGYTLSLQTHKIVGLE